MPLSESRFQGAPNIAALLAGIGGRLSSLTDRQCAQNNAVINPLDFGVRGDGVTDDSAAWGIALAAARALGNAILRMPPMTTVVSVQLDVSSLSIVGDGPMVSRFVAAPGFAAASVLLKSGDATTGEGRAALRGFAILGNRAAQGSASAGLIVEGNCLYNVLDNIEVSGMKGTGVIVRNAHGLHPSLNVFREVNVTDCDGDGWEVRSGQNLLFHCVSGENVLGVGLNVNGADEYVTDCVFVAPWIENVGQGKDGVVVDRARNVTFLAPQVSAYGSNPATTGHGFNVTSATSPTQGLVIDAPNITGRAASAAGSRMIYWGSAVRCELRRAPAGTVAADVEVAGNADVIVTGGYDATFGSNELVTFRNASLALNASATIYLSANDGYADATESNAQHTVCGRIAVAGLRVALTSTPGAGTAVFTLFKNGAPTGVTVTLTAANFAAGVATTSEVAFAPGDTLSLQAIGGASNIPIGGVKATLVVRR